MILLRTEYKKGPTPYKHGWDTLAIKDILEKLKQDVKENKKGKILGCHLVKMQINPNLSTEQK